MLLWYSGCSSHRHKFQKNQFNSLDTFVSRHSYNMTIMGTESLYDYTVVMSLRVEGQPG